MGLACQQAAGFSRTSGSLVYEHLQSFPGAGASLRTQFFGRLKGSKLSGQHAKMIPMADWQVGGSTLGAWGTGSIFFLLGAAPSWMWPGSTVAFALLAAGAVAGYYVGRACHRREIARLVAGFPCAALVLDWHGTIVHCNRASLQRMVPGITNPQGLDYREAFPPAVAKEIGALLTETAADGGLKTASVDHFMEFSSGQVGRVRALTLSERRSARCAYLVLIEDATASVELRRALDWAALAQNLAHEIKNPLHTVLLTLQRLQIAYRESHARESQTLDRYVNSAIEEIERLRDIANGFLRFTSLKPSRVAVMGARALVEAVERQVRQWLPQTIQLLVECEEGLPDVRVDMEGMQRLFFNLFDNAVRAMRGKGRIFFRASLTHWLVVGEPARKEFVTIEVADTGCGIPEELLGRVFEPYVSGRKGGTGLGLSICRHIAKEHGGRLSIQSKVGVGTTVRLELPVYRTQ